MAELTPAPAPADPTEESVCVCIVCSLVLRQFDLYDYDKKQEIVKTGRPTPTLANLNKQIRLYTRHFQIDVYRRCEWLTGCDNKALLYCWPCLLFSDEVTVWNNSGFSDLNNLHKLIKRHSASKAHVHAIVKEKIFAKPRFLEHPLNKQVHVLNREQHNQHVRKSRDILKRLIDVVCFLGEHELPFRGHVGSEHFPYRGNYVDLLSLVAKYDETLKFHLEHSTFFTGTAVVIQNDIISSVVEVVLKKIKREIEETSFIAVILVETIDAANIIQWSKVVRYVTKKGEVKERFLGFFDVSLQRTSTVLYDVVQSIVEEFQCSSKIVAQSYVGDAVTPGELGGLHVKVKQTYPNALFVHCTVQRINLVLQQSVRNIKECKAFFSTLSGMASFFSKSPKRTAALNYEVRKILPKVALTGWNYNGRLLQTVSEYRQPLINFFENVLENQHEWDSESVVCCRGYLDIFKTDNDFNFLLLLFSEVFPFSDCVFAALQNKFSDINFCVTKIIELKSVVLSKREQFDRFWNKLKTLNEVEPQRKKGRNAFGDEKICYKKLFFKIIDTIYTYMDVHFANFKALKFTELINFNFHKKFPEDAFECLKENYSECFDFSALRSELFVVYNTSEGLNKNSVMHLWKSIKEYGLHRACLEVLKLCELTQTIPATKASTDSSFSALQRIENFVTKFAGQERLSNLALLSIEKDLIQEMSLEHKFYDDVIDEFAKKSTHIPLAFK